MQRYTGAVAAAAAALVLITPAPTLNVDGAPPAHTGGFGEPTCQACHVGGGLNAPGGALGVEGLPTSYRPGEPYRIRVVLHSEDMTAAGFQAALRFSGGDLDGTQAGRLEPIDSSTSVRRDSTTDVRYVQHSASGSGVSPSEVAVWSFRWTAPREEGVVLLHVAANSANGDNSPLGDLIYTAEERTTSNSR